ncbi:unnamed protein product [Cochlearia groenlandica]
MATSNEQINTKISHSHSHNTLLLIILIFLSFFLFIICLTNPTTYHQYSATSMAISKRVLRESSIQASSTMDLPSKTRTRRNRTSRRREFGNDAHEVPSGPNPISN